ncbi:MAG: polyprenol monophosphomannose synthase [Acidimicrobiales bacterium]
MRALVVLPTYEEADNIEVVLARIRAAVPLAHVLVVDDASPDGTAALAEETGRRTGQVDVLRRPAKAGLGSAYRDGFAWGLAQGFDALVEMDADLSHDPAALPSLLAPLGDEVELVVGSRYVPGGTIPNWAPHRRALSRLGNVYAGALLGLPVRDLTSGYRAYAASVLHRMDLEAVRADGYGFQIEMVRAAVGAGAGVREVPITFMDRERGRSKMSMRTIVEALGLVTWWGAGRALRALRARGPAAPAAPAPRLPTSGSRDLSA